MRKLVFTVLFLLPLVSGAHTRMDTPVPRDPDDGIKAGPCGPYVKPAVNNPANVYTEGAEIDIAFTETVNHTGYFWVDLAMDDVALTNYNPNDPDPANNTRANVWRLQPPLAQANTIDANGNFIDDNPNSGFQFQRKVVLPTGVTCDNCTLRIVQFMEGRVQPYYYTCSDVKIQAANGGGDNGGGDNGSQSNSSVTPPGSQSQFGGCGSIDSSSGPGGPFKMAFLFFLLLPLAVLYAGKMSPIALRR